METWDILDDAGKMTGKTLLRGDKLKANEYHLIVHIWMVNSKGEMLIQKRPNDREFAPGLWAITGGSAIEGEDSLAAVKRETKEELGITICPISQPIRYKRLNDFTDIWVLTIDLDIKDMILQKEEVSDVKWVTKKELNEMINRGEFYKYSQEYFRLLSQHIDLMEIED